MSLPEKNSRQPDDYVRRTDAEHRKYQTEYAKWLATLSPEERKQVESLGLNKPVENPHSVSGHAPSQDRDAAESSHASVTFDPGVIDVEPPTSEMPITPEAMLIVTRIVGTIISHENVRIATAALAFALNMNELNGLGSLREYAKKIGVSPEAVSKMKRKWERDLKLPPNAFSKTPTAKAALSLAQQTKHWKKAKWKRPAGSKPAH